MIKTDIFKTKIFRYVAAVVMVLPATVSGMLLKNSVDTANFTVFYLLMVVLSAIWWGMGPAIVCSFGSMFAFDFFFVQPYYSFSVNDFRYLYIFFGFLIIGIITGLVASKAGKQAEQAAVREAHTAVLYRMSRELAVAASMHEVILIIRKNISELLQCKSALFLPEGSGLEAKSLDDGFPVDEHEIGVASWVYAAKQPAGAGTGILNAAKSLYVPLETSQFITGVLGINFGDRLIKPDEEMDMVMALASQSAVALQRVKLAQDSRQMELAKQTEKLQTALLNSISHDLRTPLVSITGALSTLLQDYGAMEKNVRNELLETAYEESMRLNRLVGNMLDMTRVEAGTLKINKKPCDLRDVIGSSLQSIKDKLEKREVKVFIPEDIFEIPMDFTLMMRVFINLVDNAAKYSPQDSLIEITALKNGDKANIVIKDLGFGIPMPDLEHIFDKFYRAVKPKQVGGTGLGLSICRGIVEAHGGRIWAQNNTDKGASIFIELPLKVKNNG
jgi:two-component system, OmpR family, sensor histidine kinase KdpD